MVQSRPVQDGPTALYRYFDERDRLLYVGITNGLGGRILNHIRGSRWMDLAARSTIARYPSRRKALQVERAAIETEHPLFNIQYNDTPEARQRLRTYLEEIGRIDLLGPWRRGVPPGELDQPKRWPSDDADGVLEPQVDVIADHVIDGGIVTLYVSDSGGSAAEVYLSGTEARELGETLLRRASEVQGPASPERPSDLIMLRPAS